MKDLDSRGNILSGTKYRVSPEGVSLMDETNNLAMQVGGSPNLAMQVGGSPKMRRQIVHKTK